MRPLRITVPLGTGETPQSFTSRLAAANRLSAREFCLDFGLHFQAVVDGKTEAIAMIAELGGVDPSALAADAFVRGEKHSCTYRGERLVRSVLCRTRVRVCPCCLTDDIKACPDIGRHVAVHGRGPWLIEAMKTCPDHHIGLVEVSDDPAPGTMHDFVHHVSLAVPRLDMLAETATHRRPSRLEAYLLSRLAGVRTAPFLDSLELHAAIRTCEMIGAVAAFGRTPNLKRLRDDEWWRAGAAGFEIAAGGKAAIGEFLTELQRTYPYGRSGKEGPQALFGRLYQWLEFGAEDRAYDPVRAVIGRHIGDKLPVGPGDVIFGTPVAKRHLHSVRTLSLETGLHPTRLRKILNAVGLITRGQAGLADHNVFLPADTAMDAVRRAKGAVPLRGAGLHLNAPRVHIRQLASYGFIRPFVAARAFAAEDQFAIEDLDEFLGRLLQDAHVVSKPKHNQFGIPAACKRACCSAADILHLIIDRKLKWIGRLKTERGYLSVLVDIDEIRAQTRGPEHGGLTPREAAKILGCSDCVIWPLVEVGALTTCTVVNPINRCPQTVIMPEEVAKFQQKYVSLFTLAKERGKHFKAVKSELTTAGVEPAFKPNKIGAMFYARAQL